MNAPAAEKWPKNFYYSAEFIFCDFTGQNVSFLRVKAATAFSAS